MCATRELSGVFNHRSIRVYARPILETWVEVRAWNQRGRRDVYKMGAPRQKNACRLSGAVL